MNVTHGFGCERSIDCSVSNAARVMALRCTREWSKMAMVGEGSDVTFNPSPDLMHGQKSIYGSWVTSLWRTEELVEHLVRWNIHPDRLITHRFELKDADKAYALMAPANAAKWPSSSRTDTFKEQYIPPTPEKKRTLPPHPLRLSRKGCLI